MNFLSWLFERNLSPKEVENEVERLCLEDPIISNLHKKLNTSIKVEDCQDENIRAYYNIKQNKIIISPYGFNYNTLHEALLHEYIHAYDQNVNDIAINTLEGLASTEIHAAKYCECANTFFFKRQKTFSKAVEAVTCSIHDPDRAYNAVNSVFSKVYEEKIPFLEFSPIEEDNFHQTLFFFDPYQ